MSELTQCVRVDVDVFCRWCLCARRNVSYNLPWLSWKCSWMSSRGWCSGWRTPSIAHSSTQIAGSHNSRRNMRGAYSSYCSSVEVQITSQMYYLSLKKGCLHVFSPLRIYYKFLTHWSTLVILSLQVEYKVD